MLIVCIKFDNCTIKKRKIILTFYFYILDVDETQVGNSEDQTNPKPKKKNRFEIKKWTAVAFWSWDQTNETCAICRNHLMEPCIECQGGTNNERNECPRAVGNCNHSFHLHCITTWIKTRNSCPLDNTEWKIKEVSNN